MKTILELADDYAKAYLRGRGENARKLLQAAIMQVETASELYYQNEIKRVINIEPVCRKRKQHLACEAYTSDQMDKRIDTICGCKGQHDCGCVSVFGQARSELWYEFNTSDKPK